LEASTRLVRRRPPMDSGSRLRVSAGLCGLVVALLSFGSPVLADTVTPTGRAVNGVIVRKAPTTDSQRVGALSPGDTAELIETAGGWRKVRLFNGDYGCD